MSRRTPFPRPTAGRHSTRLVASGALTGLAFLTGLTGLTACSAPPEQTPPEQAAAAPAPPPRPAATAAVAVTSAMPADVVDMVLPTTGEQTRLTQGLDAFGRLAADKALRTCLAEHRTPAPPHEPPAFVRFSDIPDLPFIDRNGFNGVIVPGAADSTGDRPAEGAGRGVQDRCMKTAAAVEQSLRSVYVAVQSSWFQEESSLRTHPRALAALKGFGPCMADRKIAAPDENAFFALVDQRMQAGDTTGEHTLARAYSACMKPAEDVRSELRKALGTRFRADHRQEIDALNTALPAKIREFERRYEVRISFPAL
ncbi:hypothetical protein ACFCWD_38425 [Streptomyces sp. NPDC056374]|uniref:hypothetical protein n=1 Tax=unclassified Streptomyces TaxID=2593676 RepID=UPI0035DE89D1